MAERDELRRGARVRVAYSNRTARALARASGDRAPRPRIDISRTALAVAPGSPPVGEREVVTVSLVVLVQLPGAGESRAVVAERCAAALSEPRGVALQRQLSAVEPDRVDSMDTARVEVLHREVVLALHNADHAERVGKVGVLVED